MSVNFATPFVPTRRTRIEHLLQNQDKGKARRILAGSYIDDLITLKKCPRWGTVLLPNRCQSRNLSRRPARARRR